jgi:hypothetical protein
MNRELICIRWAVLRENLWIFIWASRRIMGILDPYEPKLHSHINLQCRPSAPNTRFNRNFSSSFGDETSELTATILHSFPAQLANNLYEWSLIQTERLFHIVGMHSTSNFRHE